MTSQGSSRLTGLASRLIANDISVEEKQEVIGQLRDNVEELTSFCQEFIGSFTHVLESVSPQEASNAEHKLRKSVLEVINRVPHTEVLKEHVPRLAKTLLTVATNDNQENAIVAIKVILDLLRAFKPGLDEVANPLLRLFTQFYEKWDSICRHYFDHMETEAEMEDTSGSVVMDMQPSQRSFRVIAECPITVLHLLQLYGTDIRHLVSPLISLMVKALSFDGLSNEIHSSVQQAYKDMKFAQVKTVAFLSHCVKQTVPLMQPHEQEICDGLMNLLKTCPDVVQWRRELLISTRTLLATDFRKTLDSRLNDFKDESAVVGQSRACHEALRHYGYAVFAELAHQTRQKLNMDQLLWIVQRSCCVISDVDRPAGSHSTAARLLFHLVDVIHRQRFRQDGTLQESCRELLRKILLCFCVKLDSLKNTKKLHNDIQSLLQNLFLGLRTVLCSLATFNRTQASQLSNICASSTLTEQEIRFTVKIVKGGMESLKMCIRLKMQVNMSELMELFVEPLNVLDPRDFVEIMAARISYLYDTLNSQIELHPIMSMLLDKQKTGVHLLSLMVDFLTENKLELLSSPENPEYLFILKLFKLLFHALMKQDIHQLMMIIDPKVLVLISNLVKIAKTCIEKIGNAVNCQGYVQLLWFLFRYLNRSRNQFPDMAVLMPPALELFLAMLDAPNVGTLKEMLIELCLLLPMELEKKYPFLPKLMKPLLMALRSSDDKVLLAIQTMEEWIDRLNPVFLEPAMSAYVQEINLALWSHLSPQPGNPLGPRVLQLLGKLGGRNRCFLADPLQLDWKNNPEHGLRLLFSFPGATFGLHLDECINLTCQGLFKTPRNHQSDPVGEQGAYYRQQGMKFIHGCLASMMNLTEQPDTPSKTPLTCAALKKVMMEAFAGSSSSPRNDSGLKIKSQFLAAKQTLTSLIASCIMFCADADLQEEATIFARGVCHYFAILFCEYNTRNPITSSAGFFLHSTADESQKSVELVNYLEPNVFIDAVIEVLTNEQSSRMQCGAQAISWFLQMMLEASKNRPSSSDRISSHGSELRESSVGPSSEQQRTRNLALECGFPAVAYDLLQRVLDCCFGDTWTIKDGGICGIEVIVKEMPSTLLRKTCPQILRGLLHVMFHLPSHALTYRTQLRNLLLKLESRIVELDPIEAPTIEALNNCREINQIIGKLSYTVFLLDIPEIVREDCHAALSFIANSVNRPLADILDPYVSLQEKGLRRSLEECIQISNKFRNHPQMLPACSHHMEGLARLVIYCIEQRLPSVCPLLKQILDSANFAAILCDVSEEGFLARARMNNTRIVKFRGFCKAKESAMKMLVTISGWDIFLNNLEFPDSKKTLETMVSLFFKTLIGDDDKLREISKNGLSKLIEQHRISRYDTQPYLKPILSSISQFPSLDLNVLRGGAEALRMLSDWFNQTLGEKFLDNLKMWLDHDPNIATNQKPWSSLEDTKIAAAILELFHLLPSSAVSFLETQTSGTDRIGLVVLTIELEDRLGKAPPVGPTPHVLWSPYRAPLTKFLIRYKEQAVSYFLAPTRMQNLSYVNRFIDIIKSKIGEPLLLELLNSAHQIRALLHGEQEPSEPQSSAMEVLPTASIHALYLLKTIVKLKPNWLPTQECLYRNLCSIWRSLDMKERVLREETMSHMELIECKALAKCMLNYISVHHEEVKALVSLLSVFETTSKVSFSFIKEYCTEFVPTHYSHTELHNLLVLCFSKLGKTLPQSHSIIVLRYLVIPILESLKEKGKIDQVVTGNLVQLYLNIIKKAASERDVCLDVELLDAGRLLVVGAPNLFDADALKVTVKYAWTFLKQENMECKSHAFLLLAYIFKAYESVRRVVGLQVFVSILKSDFSETKRELIQEALSVMVPAFSEKQKGQSSSDEFPTWIQHCRKHMSSEGHKLNVLMNLWQTVISQPDLFYEYRSQFLGPMVNTLSRLRRPPFNSNAENRQMAVDMERVIVDWEVKRVKGGSQDEAALPSSSSSVSPPPLAEETFTNMKKMIVIFMAKTLFTMSPDLHDGNKKSSYRDTMGILSRALDVWPDVEFRLDFMERFIESGQLQPQYPMPIISAGLDLVSLALQYQPEAFLTHSSHHLLSLAQRVVTSKKEDLVDKLCTALETVFELESAENTHLQAPLESQLLAKYLDHSPLNVQGNMEFEISACLKILETDKHNKTEMITRFLAPLVKLLERYSREYSVLFQNSPGAPLLNPTDAQRDSIPFPKFGHHLYNVCKILDLCGNRLMEQPAQTRNSFLLFLVSFVSCQSGRFPDRAVFHSVLTIVSNWLNTILTTGDGGFDVQQLVFVFQHIAKLDANGLVEVFMKRHFDSLFLARIYEVCTSQNLNKNFRNTIFIHVEQTLLCGIRTTTPELRKKFFELYQECLGNTLADRLKYILEIQDWKEVSTRFWLKQALDYLLVFLNGEDKIFFARNSAQLISFPFKSYARNEKEINEDRMEGIESEKTTFDLLIEEHVAFLNKTSGFHVSDLVEPLREYAHVNPGLAYHLWVLIFPIVWAVLDRGSHAQLAKSYISLLLKPYHRNQSNQRPNVIQGLLEGISFSQPQPRVASDLIKFLGKTYNAWHIAILLLESHCVVFHDEARYFDALNELYKLISETDMMFGLMKRRFHCMYSQSGISLMQYGYWEEAMHVFGEGAVQSSAGRVEASSREVLLWSEEWCRCAKELNQWEELHEWAESTDNMAILADSSWRVQDPDWMELRQILQTYKVQIPDALQYSILMIYSAFQDNNLALCSTHIGQATDQCLLRWWQLPEVGVLAQASLLQKFQQVVELVESSRAFMEFGPPRSGRHEQANYIKDILESWRLRTPNAWEPFSVWSDIYIWRHIIYCSIANFVSGSDPAASTLHHICVRDKACSINKLAGVARKHGALDLCIDIETNMYNESYMHIHEACLKIVEQSKAYLLMDNEKMTGLNMLCSTNLEHFPHQALQAEIFRLEGELYRAMNNPEMANESYSTSITLNHSKPESWLCWGAFCDEIHENNKQDPNHVVHLEYAIGCYFQAMCLNSSAARAMIPRCLQLLSFDKSGTVEQAFRNALGQGSELNLPPSIWLFYIPQILSVSHRPEGDSLKLILRRIATSHPQALFYYLRVHMLNAKEAAHDALEKFNQRQQAENPGQTAATVVSNQTHSDGVGASSNGTGVANSAGQMNDERLAGAQANFESVKELFDFLKHQLGQISHTLEIMLREIASSFHTKSEERLMAVVHALLARCYKVPGAQSMNVPQNLIREIDGVCQACCLDSRTSSPLLKELKESFLQQLNSSSPGFPATLGELTDLLKSWRDKLSRYLEDQMPTKLQLHRESVNLQDLTLHNVEMPCQYSKLPEPPQEAPAYLDKIGSEIEIIRRQGTAIRRLSLYDSEGRKTYYIIQNGQLYGQPVSGGERMLQLMRLLNRLLNKHHQCRGRFLSFWTPVVVPVWNRIRLVEEDPSFTSFFEAFEINCASLGKEADYPVLHFKWRVYSGEGDTRRRHYPALLELSKLVPENVFSLYMNRILPSSNHLWVFKKQFCAQMALSSLMSVMLCIGGRAPGKILFSRSSGRVFQIDFVPALNNQGLVVKNEEAVPFRLTVNLSAFFTPFGVEGCFMTTMVVAAMAFVQRHSNLESCLSLFFRDELLTWICRREERSALISNIEGFQSTVMKNTAMALEHIKNLCPIVPKVTDEGQPPVVDKGVRDLIESATQPHKLCNMDPIWHPWY